MCARYTTLVNVNTFLVVGCEAPRTLTFLALIAVYNAVAGTAYLMIMGCAFKNWNDFIIHFIVTVLIVIATLIDPQSCCWFCAFLNNIHILFACFQIILQRPSVWTTT
jgi:hypothetical protein